MRVNFETGLKRCPCCCVAQPLQNFSRSPGTCDKLQTYCRKCNQTKRAEYRRQHPDQVLATYLRRRHKHSVNSRKRKYGLSAVGLFALMWKQRGKCAGCQRELHSFKRFCIDHSHVTGKVRGLLCDDCNLSLGRLRDDPTVLHRLADYLTAHGK
jgi:Recombination endonuclease VII